MKNYILLFTLLAIVNVKGEKYSKEYSDIDINRILQNGRILTNYIKCMLDEGPCTNEGRELKKILPDTLSTGCSRCTEKQRATAQKIINHLMTSKQKEWNRLVAKYDPKNEYKNRYEHLQSDKKT